MASQTIVKKNQLFLLVAMALAIPSFRTSADAPVTFEVVATFDYPGAVQTYANGINDRGEVAGFFLNDVDTSRGYVRFSDGRFSGRIMDPKDNQNYTVLPGINNTGTACGNYSWDDHIHSFLLSGGTFTEIPLSAPNVYVWGVNDAGDYCGSLPDQYQAFLGIGNGTTYFTVPGATSTSGYGINNLNQCVGSYALRDRSYGFRRDADATLNYPIGVLGATTTVLTGINDNGVMAGWVAEGYDRGVCFRTPNDFALYDYPGASATVFNGINNRGLICGTYTDASLRHHGFMGRVRSAASE